MIAQSNLNLAGQSSTLINRVTELTEICSQLADPECRLLTLVGPGGIGKTRLAVAVAERINSDAPSFSAIGADKEEKFPDGVYFVPLQSVTSAELIIPAIATAIGLPLAGQEPLFTQLLHHLCRKQMLLVLDNFEHLLPAADLLAEVLRQAPAVKLLITSREALSILEEWLYPIQGLAVPPADVAYAPAFSAREIEKTGKNAPTFSAPMAERVGKIEEYGAVQLFCLRARHVRRDFHWESEREAVVSICRQVEGNPLAVELAASWLSTLTSAAIAAQLRQGMEILTSSLRDVPERHRSMRVVFDHSWQLLGESERAVFARLTVFRGGFTLAAAQAVAGATLGDLSALVAKSLIRRDAGGRYQIHEVLRQYGSEKLAASPTAVREAHAAHADYFIAYLNERDLMYETHQQLRSVREIAAEYENARLAWMWFVTHLQTKEETKSFPGAVKILTSFYQTQSRYLEGAELLDDAIRLLESNSQVEERASALAECLLSSSWMAIRLGRIAEAEQAVTRALRIYDRLPPDYHYRFAELQMVMMILSLVQGDYERAAALAQEIRCFLEERNELSSSQLTYYGSASAALAQGQYEQAREYAEQGLALMESVGNRWLSVHIYDILGQIASIQGDLPAATRHFEAAYAVSEEFGAPGLMALHLKNLGDVAVRQQRWEEAHAFYIQSLELNQFIGDRGGAITAECGLGITAYHLGDLKGARRHFRHALETAVATDTTRLVLTVLAAAGEFLAEQPGKGRREIFSPPSPAPMAENGGALGPRLLRFVAHHPLTDQTTRNEVSGYLQRKSISPNGAANDSLEMLTAALQAELTATPPSPVPPPEAHSFARVDPLTAREIDVLKLLGAGCTNAEIAHELIVATGTVKFFTSSIYRKLGVSNRAQAIVRAHELGILD